MNLQVISRKKICFLHKEIQRNVYFVFLGSLLLLTNYLFMDSNPKADQRAHLMTKFTSLALGLKSLGSESSWLMLGVEILGSKIP